MIGGIINKLIDTREAQLSAEAWERNFNRQLQENAELIGRVKRLERERTELKAQISDYRKAADGDTRRLVAENSQLRKDKQQLFDRAKQVAEERDAAVTARRVAESALSALRHPPLADTSEADRHRANALRLSDINDRQRAAIEAFEADIAELRARIKELEHPK